MDSEGCSVSAVACALAALLGVAIFLLYSKNKPFSLDDRVVLITGAGSGIGKCLARTICSRAARVTLVLLDIDARALAAVQSELLPKCEGVFIHTCDVSDDVAVDACVKQVLIELAPAKKRIDVLVNNAGIVAGKPLLALSASQIRATFAVNTLAHFWMVRAVLPSMKQDSTRDAMIVSISSILSFMGSAGLTDYCASKAAVNSFHESLLLELQRDRATHIRTLLVCPSAVDTGMFDGVLQGDSLSLKLARQMFPLLSEQEVVDSVVDAMQGGKRKLVYCLRDWRKHVFPWLPPLARLLPVELHDYLLCIGGGRDGMDAFVGRKAPKAL